MASGEVAAGNGALQHQGSPYRVLYAFDPRRTAILLVGGDKTGDDRWYEAYVPVADRLYDEHVEGLRREERLDGSGRSTIRSTSCRPSYVRRWRTSASADWA